MSTIPGSSTSSTIRPGRRTSPGSMTQRAPAAVVGDAGRVEVAVAGLRPARVAQEDRPLKLVSSMSLLNWTGSGRWAAPRGRRRAAARRRRPAAPSGCSGGRRRGASASAATRSGGGASDTVERLDVGDGPVVAAPAHHLQPLPGVALQLRVERPAVSLRLAAGHPDRVDVVLDDPVLRVALAARRGRSPNRFCAAELPDHVD